MSLLSLCAAPAFAQTATFTFGAAQSCPTYCAGFSTDNPDYTVDFVNPNYAGPSWQTIIAVNGVYYRGTASYVTTGAIGSHLIWQETNVPCYAPDGSSILLTMTVEHWVTRVNSGRAHYSIQHNVVLGGSVTIP